MLIKYIPLQEDINKTIGGSVDCAKIVTAAIALAISNRSSIPTCEVVDPVSHFNMQLMPSYNEIISEFNENIIFDLKACIEQARMFWLLRYTAAYPASRPIYSFNLGFFETLFGVNLLVSPELAKFLDDNKNAVLSLSLKVTEIIASTKE